MRLLVLILLLAIWPTAADARWREASTRHFLIYSEGDEAEIREAAEQLERFDSMLRVRSGVGDPDRGPAARTTIYFVRDVNRLRQIFGNTQSSVWGFYLPYASGAIILTPRQGARSRRFESIYGNVRRQLEESFTPQVVMLHEYVHQFMFNNFDFGAPLWLSEGYPELYSTAQFEEDGSIVFGASPSHRSFEIADAGEIDARQILLQPDQNYRIAGIYGIGWLMSHYLTFEPSRAGQLHAYAQALAAGREPEEAASVFGDLGQLTSELRRYRTSRAFPASRVPASQLSVGPIAIRELSAAEDAIMDERIRVKRGVRRSRADDVARDVRRAAQRYPNDPVVQVTLAEAEYDARNWDAAEAAADRALAASPNMVDAMLYKARAIWGRAEAAEDKTPETWERVRALIAAANRLDPEDPEPLMYFYQTFKPAGQTPTENAVAGLLRAQELAPQDPWLRLMATREMLALNMPNRAQLLMAAIVHAPHRREDRTKIDELMALIRAGDSQGALAKMDAVIEEAEREREEDD